MKRLSRIIKEAANEVKPGNQLMNTGVTNHYTPIQNILTNVKNLFCLQLGIVATIGEDNVSIKLSSSQFITKEKVNELLWRSMYNDVFTYGTSSLQGYITSQGLPKVTTINIGGYYVVYFSPNDIATAEDPYAMAVKSECPCPCETCESLYDEFEINRVYEGDDLLGGNDDKSDDKDSDDKDSDDKDSDDKDSDEKKDDDDDSTLDEILNNEDLVKAAKQLEIFIAHKVNLPRDFYCAAIKFKNDDEAIALRWKYTKKLPTGNSTENTRSIMHIFVGDEKKIWVQDYAKESIVELPKEIKTLIENILKLFKAQKTKDPDIYELKGGSSDKDEENSDDNLEDNNSEDNKNQDNSDNDFKDNDKKDDLL